MAKDQLMDVDKALELFEPVLGFEVHVELSTQTKMFSAAPNPAAMDDANVEPNTCITPLCLGLPGSLPVVNTKAVEYSVSLGLALGCQIAPVSRFARKNYFYPDLAKNYQISQYDEPIAFEGSVAVEMDDGTLVNVPIERAHMEEDAGKLTHVGGATGRIQGAEYSLVDYNRAGVPLVEIVTKPIEGMEHRAGELGRAYVSTIRDIVRALGISNARMERGNLRCDANVSLRPRGQAAYGTRTETKNVNSFRSIERAVMYEIRRQAAILAAGGSITQETRHWHEDTGVTSPGRPSQTLMTTGISRSLTFSLRKRTLTGSKHSKRHFPKAPSTCVVDCGLTGDLVTSISRPSSTQALSPRFRPQSRPVLSPLLPGSGGWARSHALPMIVLWSQRAWLQPWTSRLCSR